jgi:ornithine--oxo-acid transaminase
MFAFEHFGIRPDCISLGKALGGGVLPVSAFVADDEVMGVFHPGDHGSTFGGNPLAAAVGLAALEVLEDEALAQRADRLGALAMERLRALKLPVLREVRGLGLLIGLELTERARPWCEALMRRGVLCKETHDRVIRLAPPLTISEDDLMWGVEQVADVLTKGYDA